MKILQTPIHLSKKKKTLQTVYMWKMHFVWKCTHVIRTYPNYRKKEPVFIYEILEFKPFKVIITQEI